MDKINKLIKDQNIDKSWLYYFQNIINKIKETEDENNVISFINSNEFNYLYFSLNYKNIRVIVISKNNSDFMNYLNKGILYPKINNNNRIFWKYMLQLFYNIGSIVWFVGNIKYKSNNDDEEDESCTNLYNSIKEITKSTYVYKINPKIKINVTISKEGKQYGGITTEKQLICNHYLKQLFQKEIDW